jgi:hypothetical protein
MVEANAPDQESQILTIPVRPRTQPDTPIERRCSYFDFGTLLRTTSSIELWATHQQNTSIDFHWVFSQSYPFLGTDFSNA